MGMSSGFDSFILLFFGLYHILLFSFYYFSSFFLSWWIDH